VCAVVATAVLLSGVASSAATPVVVYSALENDEIAEYLKVARQDLPDLDIRVLRLSTGELAARVLAEKGNPQADVLWGVAATATIPLVREGALEPYVPKGAYKILRQFRDPKGYWTGIDLYVGAIAVNTVELSKRRLPVPRTWNDLLNPQYKGLVIMPNPLTSGTGFLHVVAVLTKFGESRGWQYLTELDRNIAQYTRSGGAPARMAAQGEIPIALSLDFAVLTFKQQGYPVELVWPDGTGYELEVNALVKGARNGDAARRFLDWAISLNAMRAYARWKMGVTMPGVTGGPHVPQLHTVPLLKVDLQWAAENRQRILDEWKRRFTR
jgi:iron(III) transport system substrate-binding protein